MTSAQFINFIDQTSDIFYFNNLENVKSIYHYSIPNTKLAYPEPFIASASFMHSDLWFVHILIYQYWLWFVFIFIIVFFFITFLATIRWCNMRIRPRRETRGVSRSKCGDLITATVPVSWATSIIVNESTDAIDYYDGFGTTELVVGIRAYQWGWEYYYPKDIDLSYNIKPNYSIFLGNSLKYNRASDLNLHANNVWKFYQNKTFDQVVTPAHLLVVPSDNNKLLNFLNFNDVGSNTVYESNAFKRIRTFSKAFTSNLLTFVPNQYSSKYKEISLYYLNRSAYIDSYLYGFKRQHTYLNKLSYINSNSPFLDVNSCQKLISLNYQNNLNLQNNVTFGTSFFFFNKLTNPNLFLNYLGNANWVNNEFLFLFNPEIKDTELLAIKAPARGATDTSNVDLFPRVIKTGKFINPFIFSNRADLQNFDATVASTILTNDSANYIVTNDKFNLIENSANALQDKDTFTQSAIPTISWNFAWLNSSLDSRWSRAKNVATMQSSFYLPLFTFYYDYDFRNWQALELLEDCFWESTDSIYNHDEYLSLVKDFYSSDYADKFINYFNGLNRSIKAKNQIILTSCAKDYTRDAYYSNFFFLEDVSANPSNTPFNEFYFFPLNSFFTNLDDNYETFKNAHYFFNENGKSLVNVSFFKTFHSHFYVLDSFRSDFDEFSWYFDENENIFKRTKKLFSDLNIDSLPFFDENAFAINDDFQSVDKNLRFSNSVNLRNTAKSSIVTYNAIQKIFKTRFDENRSHAKLNDFSYFYNSQPFISSERTSYETILKKNKENFYSINFYKNNFKLFFNSFYDVNNSINFYFFDFPFLLALKSDSSRYLWFDWFAKWGYYEVQPSSSSRYAIHGMPYFSKNFDFAATCTEVLNETENYLTRLAKARRNYLPNWTYTPYFYAKNNAWYKNNALYDLTSRNSEFNETSSNTLFVLKNAEWYWTSPSNSVSKSKYFFPSNSNINSFSKAASRSYNSIASYYYSVSTLVDILTKREYLYRELFANQNKVVSLPSAFVNSPKNPLLREIKSTFDFIDPITTSNEYSRDLYFYSLNFFNQMFFKTNFTNSFTEYGNYLINLLFNYTNKNIFLENAELYKNQYRPMRKGITNMIRLHATGAMALPIEIRLQVLASSKDVIHSWAIPSAGIKIDCVPGYSSHRVMIFLVSGIFWGQCMEICGRYHHWMPIVVYFMKRDLFFLWCTHFIFLTGTNNSWTINDKQYSDYVRLASFDKNSWLAEMTNK